MNKDWTGNKNSIYKTLGASNHTDKERQREDYYATEPKAIDVLLTQGHGIFCPNIWEPACGEGHLSKALIKHGYSVKSTDLINRGYGEQFDFLSIENQKWDGDIITNPPYNKAQEFIERLENRGLYSTEEEERQGSVRTSLSEIDDIKVLLKQVESLTRDLPTPKMM